MKVVGKGIPKIDGIGIATGKPAYTEDLAMSQALKIKILRSPHAFAKIKSIDTSEAKKLRGVACVLTYQDVPQVRFTLAGQSYPEPSPYDRLILDELVRYVGDEVAIVAAVDEQTASQALQLIKVDYEVYEPVLDFEQAAGHPSIVHPESDVHCNFDIGMAKERNIVSSQHLEVGNVEQELAQCPVVVEETYYTQAQAHAMMETYRAFSYLDHTGRLVMISSTQIPFHVRRQLARALQIPASRIRVIKPRIGGGFGGKQTTVAEIFAAIVTVKTGQPAIIIYDRRETFTCSSSRHAMRIKVRLGAEQDGTLRAMDIEALSDTGAYGEHASTVVSLVGEKTLPLYNKTQAIRFVGQVVYTNKMSAGALRGFGATQGAYAVESTFNLLAQKLNMDPGELRLKNLIQPGETCLYYQDGHSLGSSTLHQCIQRGKELIGWADKYPSRQVAPNKVRAVGMAVTMQGSGIANIDTASVEVRLGDDGSYTLLIGSSDMGTGSDTILAQMAAEILETTVDHIAVHAADTDVSPYDPGSYASSTTYVTGMAVVKAAEDLRRQIIQQGAKFLQVTPEELEFDGTVVRTLSGEKEIGLQEMAHLLVLGTGKLQLVGHATHCSPVSPPPYVAGFVEVEVDTETGKVDVLDFVAVVDCGTVINPKLATIQVEGGIVQGIGYALFEDVQYDQKGNLLTNSFMQYKIPCRKDVGKVRVFFEESYEPTGPFGAKSLGEVVINTPAPAIAQAIDHAVGVRVTNLPMTPEKVFRAMQAKK